MPRSARSDFLRVGLLFGVIAVYLCLVGVVEAFKGRWIVSNVLGLGEAFLLITVLAPG